MVPTTSAPQADQEEPIPHPSRQEEQDADGDPDEAGAHHRYQRGDHHGGAPHPGVGHADDQHAYQAHRALDEAVTVLP